MVVLFIDLVALFLFFNIQIHIFIPFPLFVSVYVYSSLCDFVCIALLLPFVLEICLSSFLVVCLFFSIVFALIIFGGFVF